MEKFTHEKLHSALEVARSVADTRFQTLSEEIIANIFPLPYSSIDEAGHEMMTSLLQQIIAPYL